MAVSVSIIFLRVVLELVITQNSVFGICFGLVLLPASDSSSALRPWRPAAPACRRSRSSAIAAAPRKLEAVYSYPHQNHATMEPMNAIVRIPGDGTAEILATDPTVFTFSMHGAKNYPFTKSVSDLDIALPDGIDDDGYLKELDSALSHIGSLFSPNLILYVAGLDVHQADRLGKLSLSDSGIERRDKLVLDWAAGRNLPVVAVMAGGYFPDLEHLTNLQLGVVERLAEYGQHYKNGVYLRKSSK